MFHRRWRCPEDESLIFTCVPYPFLAVVSRNFCRDAGLRLEVTDRLRQGSRRLQGLLLPDRNRFGDRRVRLFQDCTIFLREVFLNLRVQHLPYYLWDRLSIRECLKNIYWHTVGTGTVQYCICTVYILISNFIKRFPLISSFLVTSR